MFESDHEAIIYCNDRNTGLRAIIAIHSTKQGPALGGTRIFPYATEQDGLRDVLALSRAMTYKAAAAELPFGGGKAVVFADPADPNKRNMLQSFCRYLNMLNGNFETGEDLGTTQEDVWHMQKFTGHAHATAPNLPDYLETSALTARGVLSGIEASLHFAFKSAELTKRTITIQGLGKVGLRLAQMLHQKGARLLVSDVDQSLAGRIATELQCERVDPANIVEAQCDVLAPCAIGRILTPQTAGKLRAKVVAGCANNQLSDDEVAETLRSRGILYAPDYVINAGGLISALLEMEIENETQVLARVDAIGSRLLELYKQAREEEKAPLAIVNKRVEERL